MDRLTRKMCGGYGMVEGYELNTLQGMKAAVNRLAAYEDIGSVEHLSELAKAEQYIGMTVWSGRPFRDGVPRDGEVVTVAMEGDGEYTLCVNFDPEPCYEEFSLSDIGEAVFLTFDEAVAQ